MNIALLGAGHIGQTIARLLNASGDYRVTIMDRDRHALEVAANATANACATRPLALENPTILREALSGQDAVVNALPYSLAIHAATQAAAAGCHYFDLTEDVAATQAIIRLAEGARTAFMPQCGLAPGFISIAAHHVAAGFDSVRDLKLRVGALPAFPSNALKYNLTWSVDGLINEYCHPCDAIRDNRRIPVLPMEGLEHFSLDGVEYEAFNTSGGLGTLCATLEGKVENLDYKSVRYPGHRALMSMLLDELQLKSDPDNLKTIFRRSVPTTLQDVVLVVVIASGMRNGVLAQEVLARKIFAERTDGHTHSAIQITTAAGICAALDLFRTGKLPKRGFIRQEQINLPDFLANRFGRAYAQSTHIESIS
ncbi:saccharopine dehydrogenase [Pandoraea thiooxydans]|uniref:Saccharopine dehydrogenase n=1 Tax=Pandoraea thiooxydans TaxID=445709 RepID=A0A0G3EPL5_9BURK|nr:saccharopine dehydrogenase NADP-binding domain-containing protein [Pandoraea thiooxydans]AKJ67287.1 saccharopine dehydrogenase [Pandoraea thiooxydans]APR94290.1 saccharopine dehydrogenase [Pandoraea thiooxydans]